ncbi:Maltose excess protein 1 [Monoraphidium neglectum]|uniref:Maltose excess protein 1 n=1 Tax=Monoraphidium neglectum TaxID=145388 RepID=A0A0D2JR87_9CHLO|nr:Maltose excess protein 1 [Monoraphidium neglectum]KIZ01588.1 Maltose excess protein 1 [Monoraphidium neglectum]|eukprot:XP_013900607.1 Maltose excess protein 1 [Monoraphidium neglectum]
MDPQWLTRLAVGAAVAGLMALRGLRKRSLSPSGAAAAFLVGLVTMQASYTSGLLLILFYLTSSKLTKLQQDRKQQLEESFKVDGQRSATQVLSNSLGGVVAAVTTQCAPLVVADPQQAAAVQWAATAAFLGHYAAVCADTWASEVGILSTRPPRLVTTWRVVPPGTNGAVSALGCACSAAAGVFMGAAYWALGTALGDTVLAPPQGLGELRASLLAAAASAAPREWGALTERLVAASSLPFTVLVLPQVIQNQANIAGGALGALAAISWLGYAAGLAGNALMCTHLAARGEATAVNVQLIGIASTLLILGQLWWARVMPTRAFGGALVMAAAVAAAGSLKARGRLGRREWLAFEAVVSVFGVLAVPQVVAGAFWPSTPTLAPSLAAAAAVAFWLSGHAKRSAQDAQKAVALLPGWCATCMFALMPLPQLARNFSDLSGLGGLSLGTILLATLGNALCIPRALFTRDPSWSFGSTWGCLMMGWAQLLSLFLGRSPETGARFLPAPAFAAATAALGAYLLWALTSDARSKGLTNPFGSYGDVFFGQRVPQPPQRERDY